LTGGQVQNPDLGTAEAFGQINQQNRLHTRALYF